MTDNTLIHSPCVNICVLTADGQHCTGCYRSLSEIASWSGYDRQRKEEVLVLCEERMTEAFEKWGN